MMKVHYKVYWALDDASGQYHADTFEQAMEIYAEFISQGCTWVFVQMVIIGTVVEFKDKKNEGKDKG